jgi:predicted HTH domain antitoxin
MSLTIPDDILRSLDMSEQEMLLELAVALYAARKISFGQARRLAGLVSFPGNSRRSKHSGALRYRAV